GDRLLQEEAVEALRSVLLPMATVVTPNTPEAEALTGLRIQTAQDAREAARRIVAMGAKSVVVKGGHLTGAEAVDTLYDGREFREYRSERFPTQNTHGTGCTFASAIAAGLAKGLSVPEAVGQAKAYVTSAIKADLQIGHGHGPLDHFWMLRRG
ncbi:MAG: hydroxymethylpyrimidine/phosphomethylpyrimidine kinase, partial [Chloroflexi bacterium]|nr:hydroxymethylpyrimidine/phosphomethylpyrimidine kinase [Chloroflexota bacterium]